jgi:hypothetical protein
MSITARDILEALIAATDQNKIWASELALFHDKSERRIDFWTLEPIRSKCFRTQAYEIKVTRADFARDSAEKQSGALHFADRFWYVTPPGLMTIDELPDWAGLIEWDGSKFHVGRKAPPRQKAEPTWPFIVSLIRNSGDMRRDVGLMKAELAFYRAKHAENERLQKLNRDMSWNAFMKTGQRAAKLRAIP